jgi:hypothetical protein
VPVFKRRRSDLTGRIEAQGMIASQHRGKQLYEMVMRNDGSDQGKAGNSRW